MANSALSPEAARKPATHQPATHQPATHQPATRQPPTHYAQVLDAEASRLARELRTIGPMTRQALAERCRVRGWRQGSFEAAVRRGVATGRLRQLPYGFLAAPGRPPRR